MRSSKIITFFYILLLVTSFDLLFEENFPLPALYSVIKMFDELFIGIFFILSLLKNRFRESKLLLWIIALFVVGTIGNLYNHTKISTIILGAYSTIKPMLLFWCLAQIDFTWKDFHKLRKLVCLIFPVVFVSYILDLFIADFRSYIGIVAQAVDIRMGMRSLGGLFNRFTIATLYALMFFCFYKYYDTNKTSKYKVLFADFMFLFSFKIKDIFGFILARSFYIFKRFKVKYIIIVACVLYAMFILYANLMPEHYNEYFNSGGEDSNIARVVLSYTSIKILVDRFPFGVGWGLFASPTSQQIESPIYSQYGIDNVYGLSYAYDNGCFMSDTFWPMIFGETGFAGTILYVIILWKVFGPFVLGFFDNTKDERYLMPAFLFIAFIGFSIGKPVFSAPPIVWHFGVLPGFFIH